MRTFSRSVWDEAQALWVDGDFGDAWRPYRHEAAMRGILYPPTGTAWDTWDVDEPSQRALVWRAICDTPQALHAAIARSRSWSQVIGILLRDRDRAAEEARRGERPREEQYTESAMAIKSILERIGDS